ncbi:MAG: Hpt domain-containing protein [Rhodocyclaceae bacterium]|nr:Hpt domain-containing protein [Rhodocyclaceae bacterium]
MDAATEFDVGPLTWVKGEIDLALERAGDALAQFTGGGDATQLRFARTHLHQVRGALAIVGLDGVTQFVDSVEGLLDDLERQEAAADAGRVALAQRALDAVRHYLDDLIDGAPDQPLRLLSIYGEVLAARGEKRVLATDLFFPDLSLRPPRRAPAAPLPRDELLQLLRVQRSRFQRGLLAWLRKPDDRAGVAEMLDATRQVEATQELAAARAFWWVAAGMLTALAEGRLPAEVDIKQLCARIDLQIRRLIEGSRNVAERLMRDALYYVARADSDDPLVREVQDAYRLRGLLPSASTSAPEAAPQGALRRRLREAIAAAEEAWNKFCAGTAQSLPAFREQAAAIQQIVGELGHTDYRRLARAVANAADWLAERPSRHSEALAMEIATAILLAQNAQENLGRLGADFAHQVDVMVARLHGFLAGNPPEPGSEVPLLDEMSRQAQERLLVGQVAKEIQSNLAQIEQVLDGFFRDAGRRGDLAGLERPLHQAAGALTILGQSAAVDTLRECEGEIRRFAAADYVPDEADFERVADRLSALGFFIDAMPNGATDFAEFTRAMSAPPVVDEAAEETAAGSVEQELEQAKREARALLQALKDQPADEDLRRELKQNLETLRQDADLVADGELGRQAKAALSALDAGAPALDAAFAGLGAHGAAAPAPSAETLQLALADEEDLDAELLAIFIEEAKDVLAAVGADLVRLREQPHEIEVLTNVRRSFHTLKGSGRMVGLRELGEVAWAVEQVLNLWLRQELELTQPVFEMISEGHRVFSIWVAHLESRELPLPDAGPLVALAESLRTGEAPKPAPAAGPVEATAPVAVDETPVDADAAPLAADGGASPASNVVHADFGRREPASAEADGLPEPPADDAAETAGAPHEPAPTDVATPSPARGASLGISPTLYDIFLEEARTHVATLRREFAAFAADPWQPTPFPMARAAHTLAGISGTVGIAAVNRLGATLEHALLRRETTEHPESADGVAVVGQAIDALASMIEDVAEERPPEAQPALLDALAALYPPAAHAAAGPEDAAPAEAPVVDDGRTAAPAAAGIAADLGGVHDEIDEQLLPIFLEEAAELTAAIDEQLRAWRAAPDDAQTLRALHRLFHTLKGSARMAGAMTIGEITHAIESSVEQADKAGGAAPALIDEVEAAFDGVVHLVERLQRGETPAPAEPGPQPEPAGEPAAEAPPDEAAPAAVAGDAGGDEASGQKAVIRVRADLVDQLVNEAGELSIARTRIEGEMAGLKNSLLDLTENVVRLRRQLRDIEIQAETQMQSRIAQSEEAHAGFDPLEFDRFTRFQELTRMMAESVNDVATVQQNLLGNLDEANAAILAQARMNRHLQQSLMSVRMVPFASQADRLHRIVRQTAKALGKRANLEIRGGQVEVDRSVLDKIGAPLEHLLRNAVAHGLETGAARLSAGKPEIGEVTLTLAQEGNEIILTMADDGAGLDFERIRARGVEAGLLAPDETPDEGRLIKLIFAPGFSTADEVSQIAGRGVGMDVVKTEIGDLGGRIEVNSAPGQGTTFRLYIPLTLAVTQALLVRAGAGVYAIPSSMIEQVLDLKEAFLARIREAGEAEWLGNRYPYRFLPQLLGDAAALPEARRQYWVLLLRSGAQRAAVHVDELRGNREIVVKNIGPQLARVVGIAGATVLGDGQVVLILNPVALASRAHAAHPGAAAAPAETRLPAATLPTVMVVDDSLTVRKITGRLLEREGYQVLTAKDGVDALEQMLDVVPDVLLADIEMPRMDGFDLVRNVRADEKLKHVPVIMITSRTADKHRNYAFEIGVDHYLGKPYQEEELLALVGDYTRAKRQQS